MGLGFELLVRVSPGIGLAMVTVFALGSLALPGGNVLFSLAGSIIVVMGVLLFCGKSVAALFEKPLDAMHKSISSAIGIALTISGAHR